ncbi:hypothetical protein HKD37_04G010144 [Glycine soja]
MVTELINVNPIIYEKKERRAPSTPHDEYDVEPIDQQEGYIYSNSGTLQYGNSYRSMLTCQAHEKLAFMIQGGYQSGTWISCN